LPWLVEEERLVEGDGLSRKNGLSGRKVFDEVIDKSIHCR
jgi:hypothetical protein